MYTFLVWFSDAQTIYCATFLKTKGKRYGNISIATATGGGVALLSRGGQMPGRGRKEK